VPTAPVGLCLRKERPTNGKVAVQRPARVSKSLRVYSNPLGSNLRTLSTGSGSHRDLSQYDPVAASPDLASTLQCLKTVFCGPDTLATVAVPTPASLWKWKRVWACVVGRYLIVAEEDPWRGCRVERTRRVHSRSGGGGGVPSSAAAGDSSSVAGWAWPAGVSGDAKVALGTPPVEAGGPGRASPHMSVPPLRNQWPAILGVFDLTDPAVVAASSDPSQCEAVWTPDSVDDPRHSSRAPFADTYAGFSDLSVLSRVSRPDLTGSPSAGPLAGKVSAHGYNFHLCVPVPVGGSSGDAIDGWFMELRGASVAAAPKGAGSTTSNCVLKMIQRPTTASSDPRRVASVRYLGPDAAAGASCYAVLSFATGDAQDREDWCTAVSSARRTAQHFPVTLLWATPPWAVAWCAAHGFPVSGHPLLAYRLALLPAADSTVAASRAHSGPLPLSDEIALKPLSPCGIPYDQLPLDMTTSSLWFTVSPPSAYRSSMQPQHRGSASGTLSWAAPALPDRLAAAMATARAAPGAAAVPSPTLEVARAAPASKILLGEGAFGTVTLERALLSALVRWPGANVQVYLLHECLFREAPGRSLAGAATAKGSFPVAVKRFALPPWSTPTDAAESARRYAARDALRRWKVAVNEVMALELIRHEYNRRCLLAVNHGIPHRIEFPVLPLLLGIKDADGELQIAMTIIEGVQCLKATQTIASGADMALPVCHLPRTWAVPGDGDPEVSLRSLASEAEVARLAFDEAAARTIVRDVAESLAMLHGVGMVHRDVKPENVQLFAGRSPDGSVALRAVLLDLGFAFVPDGGVDVLADTLGDDTPPTKCAFLSTLFGTRASAAPEIWKAADAASLAKRSTPVSRSDRMYSEAVDVWGLGVVLYTLLFGVLPFDDAGGVGELKCNIMDGKFRIPVHWDTTSEAARQLIQQMFSVSPTDRPSAAQVLAHPWLATR